MKYLKDKFLIGTLAAMLLLSYVIISSALATRASAEASRVSTYQTWSRLNPEYKLTLDEFWGLASIKALPKQNE